MVKSVRKKFSNCREEEEKTIAKVIRDAKAALPEAVIYVYDNNSTDQTARIAREEGAVVRDEYMQGKGNVIRRMFREIEAQCYIMVDGDDTYPMEFAPKMVEKVIFFHPRFLRKISGPSKTWGILWCEPALIICLAVRSRIL